MLLNCADLLLSVHEVLPLMLQVIWVIPQQELALLHLVAET